MKILHTADWHLGHRLYDRDRTPEHRAALAWLLDTIEAEKVDVLIVAGDVFDVANPSSQAREMYYSFLGKLSKTNCLGAVIVGGNHDSPAMLDAPSEVLRSLNLYIVGAAKEDIEDEVIKIDGRESGDPGLIVAAVPYLRERDIRKAKFGETSDDRLADMQAGIREHYRTVAEAAKAARTDTNTPIIATGHLFAAKATDHPEKNSYIYGADDHNIEAGQFSDVFDYVALGHIHRAQIVGGQEHIRYSGSLIPLTFVEGQMVRSVRIVDLEAAGEIVVSRQINVPFFRKLLRINADIETVKEEIILEVTAFQDSAIRGLTTWAEVIVKTESRIPNLSLILEEAVQKGTDLAKVNPAIEFAKRSQEIASNADATTFEKNLNLDELDPEEVFIGIAKKVHPPDQIPELLTDFRNLRNWMNDTAE